MGYDAPYVWMALGSSTPRIWTGPTKSKIVRPGNKQTASLSVGGVVDIAVVLTQGVLVDSEVGMIPRWAPQHSSRLASGYHMPEPPLTRTSHSGA